MLKIDVDVSEIIRMSDAFKQAGKDAPAAIARAINGTGDVATRKMRRVLVKQTGLKHKTLVRALRPSHATPGGSFTLKASGGNVRVKFFGPRETRKGVSAAPWNKRRVYDGTFMKGGAAGKRVLLKSGQVFRRIGKSRLPIEQVRSGLYIAEEMVTGASEQTFHATVKSELPKRIAKELFRILGDK